MSTIACTYDEFKQMAKEFFLAIPGADAEQMDAGIHCLGLAYLGIQWEEGLLADINREVSAPIIMRLATKYVLERELVLAMTGGAMA